MEEASGLSKCCDLGSTLGYLGKAVPSLLAWSGPDNQG